MKDKITKGQIMKVLTYLEDMDVFTNDNVCGVCSYEDKCDEHLKCVDGIANYIYKDVNNK